jgi:hypothetical protein
VITSNLSSFFENLGGKFDVNQNLNNLQLDMTLRGICRTASGKLKSIVTQFRSKQISFSDSSIYFYISGYYNQNNQFQSGDIFQQATIEINQVTLLDIKQSDPLLKETSPVTMVSTGFEEKLNLEEQHVFNRTPTEFDKLADFAKYLPQHDPALDPPLYGCLANNSLLFSEQ